MKYLLRLLAFSLLATLSLAGVRLDILFQDGTTFTKQLVMGWTRVTPSGPLGTWMFEDDSLLIVNGISGPGGTCYFEQIRVTLDYKPVILPRAGWRVEGNAIVIGAGQECIPPRAAIPVRWWSTSAEMFANTPPERWSTHVGPVIIPLPAYEPLRSEVETREARLRHAIETGNAEPYAGLILPDLFQPAMGLWHPAGQSLPDQTYGGGWAIEPVSGWERNCALAFMLMDATIERHAVFWLDGATGRPAASLDTGTGHYSLARGWASTTQPEDVCEPLDPGNPYDQRRRPRKWNVGTCPYEYRLCGMDFYNGFPPHDGQHTRRAVRHAQTASELWGDKLARFFLEVVGADVGYAWPAAPLVQQGRGSSTAGTREYSWMIDARVLAELNVASFAFASKKAQMTGNWQVMRMSSGTGWTPIPSPYSPSAGIPTPFPLSIDSCPSMEAWFCAHAFVAVGDIPEAIRLCEAAFMPRMLPRGVVHPSIAKQLGYIPTFFAVGDRFEMPHRRIMSWCGPGSYFPWTALGLMAWADHDEAARWLDSMLDIPTPTRGKAFSRTDAIVRLRQDVTGRAQTIAALSALEASIQ